MCPYRDVDEGMTNYQQGGGVFPSLAFKGVRPGVGA